MSNRTWLEKQIEKHKDDFVFKKESLILKITERICEHMEAQKISRADLAKRLNTSRANITKLLNGQNNFTLDTLLRISEALNAELDIDIIHSLFKKIPNIDFKESFIVPKMEENIYGEIEDYLPLGCGEVKERRKESYA